jgi:hypothetical protein
MRDLHKNSHAQATPRLPFPFPILLTDAPLALTKKHQSCLPLSEQRRLRSIRLARKASRLPCEIRATAGEQELCCKGKINDKGSRHCQSRPPWAFFKHRGFVRAARTRFAVLAGSLARSLLSDPSVFASMMGWFFLFFPFLSSSIMLSRPRTPTPYALSAVSAWKSTCKQASSLRFF